MEIDENKIQKMLMTIEAGGGYLGVHYTTLFSCMFEKFHNKTLKIMLLMNI